MFQVCLSPILFPVENEVYGYYGWFQIEWRHFQVCNTVDGLLMYLTTSLAGNCRNSHAAHLRLFSIARVCQERCGCHDLFRWGCQELMPDHIAKESSGIWCLTALPVLSLEGRLAKILGKRVVALVLVETCCYTNTRYKRYIYIWK